MSTLDSTAWQWSNANDQLYACCRLSGREVLCHRSFVASAGLPASKIALICVSAQDYDRTAEEDEEYGIDHLRTMESID